MTVRWTNKGFPETNEMSFGGSCMTRGVTEPQRERETFLQKGFVFFLYTNGKETERC